MTTLASSGARVPEDAVRGALLGACVGASMAVRTGGHSREALASARRSPVSGARVDRVGEFSSLFDGTEGAGDEPWVASALRAGLRMRCDPMEDFVEGLDLRGRTRLEASAYAAVAAAVSAAVDGCAVPAVTSLAVMAGDAAAPVGEDAPGPDLGARLQWACALASRADDDPAEVLDLLVGTSEVVQECVPTAFAFTVVQATPSESDGSARVDVYESCAQAAELGGASTVIAPLTGALLGALLGPQAWPADVVDDINGSWPDLQSSAARWATSR